MKLENYTSAAQVIGFYAKTQPDSVAVVYDGRETTYAQLAAASDGVASALVASGVAKGDHVGILAKNSDRFIECIWGMLKVGAIVTPINWRLAAEEVKYIVEDSRIDLIFFDNELANLLDNVRDQKGLRLISLDRSEPDEYVDFVATGTGKHDVAYDLADVALQIYTSGTTGRPKGAMLTNQSLSKNCGLEGDPYPYWFQTHASDVSLVAMPLFHVGGIETAFRVLYSGGKIIVHREFNPADVLSAIEQYRLTLLALVPTALQMVIRQPGAAAVDFSCIRTFFYGASPIPAALLREALAIIKCAFVQCYGMTESCSTVVALPPEDHDPRGTPRMQSAGKPLPRVELRVADESGIDVPARTVGEIYIRSPFAMSGYWNREAATAETIGADGWLHTGDAGFLDEDGYIYIHDRVKDMIVSGGENVYPAEVESAIYGHAAVAEVAVIGVPDSVWGEAVKALIVLKPGSEFDEADIITWTRQRIAAYKCPKSVDVIEDMPKNATGKLLKTELRKPYWAGHARAIN